LEKSLEEIRDMFVHVSTFVMEQGSLIQIIEYETENAQQNVDKGADELEKARELQIKALKKKTYILIILAIILGEILIFF
jgi:t-SNARE complex subunit (syntaxin)